MISRVVLGRRFARLATDAAVRHPRLWTIFRPLMRWQFDSLAPVWDSMRMEDTFTPYEAALAGLDAEPDRVLDVGTGTGGGAFTLARRFPSARVVGVDLSERMLERARHNTPEDLRERVDFQRGDASALPFADGAFELAAHANMIPFFDEVARVVSAGGHALFAFSSGAATPIYVPSPRLRHELGRRGFTDFAEFNAGRGNALLARKAEQA